MRQSYCGLCDDCQLGNQDFLDTVFRLQEYVNRFRDNWWVHCFPQGEGFSFLEFRKGLEWFLEHRECPSCQCGRGTQDCPIRICAESHALKHCYECPNLEQCDKFDFLLAEFPEVKINLRRRQLKFKARLHHQQLEARKGKR
jgi:hypothetical protein